MPDEWEHDDLCESENIHGQDTPCWCEERAAWLLLDADHSDGCQSQENG